MRLDGMLETGRGLAQPGLPAVLAEDFRRWLRSGRPGVIAADQTGSADAAAG
jgi:hypothetical protein